MKKPDQPPLDIRPTESANAEARAAIKELHDELGATKKDVKEHPALQTHKEYLISLLAGADRATNRISEKTLLPEQLAYAKKLLNNISVIIGSLMEKTTMSPAEQEADLRVAIKQHLDNHYERTLIELGPLEELVPKSSSLAIIIEPIKKNIQRAKQALDTLLNQTVADNFNQQVKTIESKLVDVNFDIMEELKSEAELDASSRSPLPTAVTPVWNFSSNPLLPPADSD